MCSVMEERDEKEEPFWINPCGLEDEPDFECVTDLPSNRDLINEIIKSTLVSVKVALGHAKNLKEYLKRKHLSVDMENLGDVSHLFDFLKFPEADLDSSSSISNLPIAYNCIQRHAVALEQMMKDAEEDSEYLEYLRDKKRFMIGVLCSLYELIGHFHLRKYRDVTRTVIPDELRGNVPSALMIRDVIIVKRYIDLIEFLYNILSYCAKIL